MGNIQRFLDVCKLNLSTRAFTILSSRICTYGTNRIFAEDLPHIFSYSEISKTPGCGANTAHEILNMLKIESVKKELDKIVFYSVTKESTNTPTHSHQCGQCKECRHWAGDEDTSVAECYAQEFGMIYPGLDSINMNVQEAKDTIQGIMLRNDLDMIIRTSRFFGCVMFEQRKD